MKKEVLLAIIIGFGIGLIITFLIYYSQKYYSKPEPPDQSKVQTKIATPSPTPKTQAIEITSPENYELSDSETVIVRGFSTPNSYISAVNNQDEDVTRTNEAGSFEVEIKLNEGVNIISITAIDPIGNIITNDLTVSYFPTKTTNQPKP